MLVDRSRAARELWWYPYTPTLRAIALAFAALRGGASSLAARVRALVSLVTLLPKRMKELKTGKPPAS